MSHRDPYHRRILLHVLQGRLTHRPRMLCGASSMSASASAVRVAELALPLLSTLRSRPRTTPPSSSTLSPPSPWYVSYLCFRAWCELSLSSHDLPSFERAKLTTAASFDLINRAELRERSSRPPSETTISWRSASSPRVFTSSVQRPSLLCRWRRAHRLLDR